MIRVVLIVLAASSPAAASGVIADGVDALDKCVRAETSDERLEAGWILSDLATSIATTISLTSPTYDQDHKALSDLNSMAEACLIVHRVRGEN